MAFTDNSDLFASLHEEGINRVIRHVMRQRPSLANFATAAVAQNRELWCVKIDPHPVVPKRANPLFTIADPIPVPGTNFGLHFAAQVARAQVDFHPGNQFNLPPELAPPLGAQRLAVHLIVCGGIGCPPNEVVDQLIPPPPKPQPKTPPGKPSREKDDRPPPDQPRPPIVPIPTRKLLCFCVEAFAVGGVRIREYHAKPYLEPFLDGVEIVDIKPVGLENSLECYLSLMLRLSILPGLRVLLETAPLDLMKLAKVILKPTPAPAKVPNNPAIEQDLVKAFIDMEVV